MPFDKSLLDYLVCPITRLPLEYNADTDELISKAANLAYPIRHGIPIMLSNEARPLDDEDPK